MARRSLPKLCVAVFVLATFFAAEVPVVPGTSPSEDVHGVQTRDARALGSYVATPALASLADAQRSITVTDTRPPGRLISVTATVLLDLPLKVPRTDADSERASLDDD